MSQPAIQLLPAPRWPAWRKRTTALLSAATAATVLGLYGATQLGQMFCLMKRLFHIPCPACGGTRAALGLLHGDFAGALLYNPLAVAVVLAAASVAILRIAFGRRLAIRLGRRGTVAACIVGAAVFIANWVFLITSGR